MEAWFLPFQSDGEGWEMLVMPYVMPQCNTADQS